MTSNPQNDLPTSRLVRADGLEVARAIADGSVDLVYLDPPFGSGRSRALLRGRGDRFGRGQATVYHDPGLQGRPSRWLGALCLEVHRILRPGGTFFLHLDWRTVHRAKILLDRIFGSSNFRNEIIWRYATGGVPRNSFARKHDTILFYAKGQGHTFHRLQEKKYLAHRMSRQGVPEFRDERGWYRFRYLDDVWEIPWITQDARERTGYPTQKPLALLERIVSSVSNPSDLVADFCCGSGTTAVAAARMGRRWIAADVSAVAIDIVAQRMNEMETSADGESVRPAFLREDWILEPVVPSSDGASREAPHS